MTSIRSAAQTIEPDPRVRMMLKDIINYSIQAGEHLSLKDFATKYDMPFDQVLLAYKDLSKEIGGDPHLVRVREILDRVQKIDLTAGNPQRRSWFGR